MLYSQNSSGRFAMSAGVIDYLLMRVLPDGRLFQAQLVCLTVAQGQRRRLTAATKAKQSKLHQLLLPQAQTPFSERFLNIVRS
ncbi:MAG: hypothetical protein GEU75_03980 [Dehalococcoidia bacterium]|nr:hypothetical protein [Dehalococcoidia bacterium]